MIHTMIHTQLHTTYTCTNTGRSADKEEQGLGGCTRSLKGRQRASATGMRLAQPTLGVESHSSSVCSAQLMHSLAQHQAASLVKYP